MEVGSTMAARPPLAYNLHGDLGSKECFSSLQSSLSMIEESDHHHPDENNSNPEYNLPPSDTVQIFGDDDETVESWYVL